MDPVTATLDERLVRVLLQRGLAGEEDVLAGDLELRDISGRNANVLVERGGGACHVVKAARNPADAALLAREAEAYRRLAEAGLDEIAPALRDHDAATGLLVVEGVTGAEDLKTYHRRVRAFPLEVAGAVGLSLATVHAATAAAVDARPTVPPWPYAIHRPTVEALRELTPGSLDLVRTIQGRPDIGRALDDLRDRWRPVALVHGDLRWENVLVTTAADDRPRVTIIDWEQAGDGDPLWDLGAAVAGYVSAWIYSMPAGRRAPLAALPGRAGIPMEAMERAARELWLAYWRGRGVGQPDADAVKAVAMAAGARLLGAAYEATQSGGGLRPLLIFHAQVAENLLTRPAESAPQVGLPHV